MILTRLILGAVFCASSAACSPITSGLLGTQHGISGATGGLVNGISAATLYPGYWTPSEAITHDPGGNDVAATDLDPTQSTFEWMEDTVTNAAYWEALVAWARTEWATDDQKFDGTIDRTFYVSADSGTDAGAGTGRGASAWATLLYAINQVGTGNNTATKIVLEPGIHYIEANTADTGTGDPASGAATIKIQNYAGTATDPLIIEFEDGASMRLGHTFAAANYAAMKAGTYDLNVGIQVTGTSSYVEFWDPVMIGPMFEMVYTDGQGQCSAVTVLSWSGTAGSIRVIGGEITQWCHTGLKAEDLRAYGTYIHNNGAASGGLSSGHDHGIYLTGDGTASVIEGCVIVGNYTNGINPRTRSDSNLIVRGNVIAYNGGFGGNIGGFGTLVENNTFVDNNLGGILWGDASAGMFVRNNVFYEDNIETIGLGGSYTRPIGFVWTTNAVISGASFSSIPTYTAWTTDTTVPRPASLYYGDNNYYNQVTASTNTGDTAPTHTSGSVSDGAVTWRYVGDAGAESFGTTTTIDSADFNNFAQRDFRPASGSDLLSNGTDEGQGTTIGAFAAAP